MPAGRVNRAELNAAKLRALVRATWGVVPDAESPFPGGAALRSGARGFVLADERPERALGGALAWRQRWQLDELHLLATSAAGLLARRATCFRSPPGVWAVEGVALQPATPDPPAVAGPLPASVAAWLERLRAAGADPVAEGDVLVGEVEGLEVCRVVDDGSGAVLEVGIGKHDREAQRLLHGDRPALAALADAVVATRAVRRPGAVPHEINRIAHSRWLRSVLVAHPAVVGASKLAPVALPFRPDGLREQAPAGAAGEDAAGAPLLVVTSIGIDVDLVPAAADARLADPRRPRLVLAVPHADDHSLTRALAAELVEPAEIVTVPDDWPTLAGGTAPVR